ncbi:MAG TPA: VOC family protein [Tepidisphaeraceae bacterium]|nr:VOC family protein [Tepidisphaeraceae bacterium]
MALGRSKLVTFVPTTSAERARRFYESILGLRFVRDDRFAMVFSANGVTLRIVKVAAFTPAPFTILGWEVSDVAATVRKLAAHDVAFQRYKGIDQDRLGIWSSPDGSRVAWFKDPDGNLLSVSQH